MRKFSHRVRLTLVLFSSALLAGNLSAQVRIVPSVGMGVAIPQRLGMKVTYPGGGRTVGLISPGLVISGGVAVTYASFPISLMPEFNYTRFTDETGRDAHQISGGLNIVIPLWHKRISPYFVGGAGKYHLSQTSRQVDPGSQDAYGLAVGGLATNAVGYDLGGGVEFPLGSARARLEARYRHLRRLEVTGFQGRPDTYVPITLSYLFH